MVGRSLLVSVLIMFVVVVFIVLWKCIECRRYLFSLFVVVLVTSRYCVFRFYEGLCKLSWNVICVMSLSDQVHLCSRSFPRASPWVSTRLGLVFEATTGNFPV